MRYNIYYCGINVSRNLKEITRFLTFFIYKITISLYLHADIDWKWHYCIQEKYCFFSLTGWIINFYDSPFNDVIYCQLLIREQRN